MSKSRALIMCLIWIQILGCRIVGIEKADYAMCSPLKNTFYSLKQNVPMKFSKLTAA